MIIITTRFESQIPRQFLKNNHIAFEQPSALLFNSDVSGHFISTGDHPSLGTRTQNCFECSTHRSHTLSKGHDQPSLSLSQDLISEQPIDHLASVTFEYLASSLPPVLSRVMNTEPSLPPRDLALTQHSGVINTITTANKDHSPDAESRSFLCPSHFLALSHDYPREFIRVFRLWATFQNLEDSNAMAAFALLLHDKAAVWLKFLQKDQLQNFDQLLELFLQRYTVHEQAYETAAKLWQKQQGHSQTVLDFVDEISVQANQLHLNADIIFKIVLNGLRQNN